VPLTYVEGEARINPLHLVHTTPPGDGITIPLQVAPHLPASSPTHVPRLLVGPDAFLDRTAGTAPARSQERPHG